MFLAKLPFYRSPVFLWCFLLNCGVCVVSKTWNKHPCLRIESDRSRVFEGIFLCSASYFCIQATVLCTGSAKWGNFVSVHWVLCLNISQTCWIFTVALFLLASVYLTAFGSPVSFFSFSVVTCLGCDFGLLLLLQHPDQNQYRDISLCFYFLAILVE